MRKAFKWLEVSGADVEFHDYKKAGLSPGLVDTLIANIELGALINRRGTTFRQLPEATKQSILDGDKAVAKQVMLNNASIIKRPILQKGDEYLLGFKADAYEKFIK